MDFQRTKHAKKNILTGILNKVVSIFMPFVVRTVVIREMGMNYLGLDNLFTSILQILNLSELGLSSAIVYCMYRPFAEQDIEKINALYCFIKKAYRYIGIIVLAVGLCLLPFLSHLINGEPPQNVNIYVMYLLYLANSSLSFFLFAYKNVILNVNQRLDILNNILSISKMVMFLGQIIVLFLCHNYYVYILFLPISTIINNLITSIWVDNKYPQYKADGKLDLETKKQVKTQVMGLCIGKMCLVSRNSFDSIITSAFLGLVTTAIYNNYFYIMNAVVSVVIIFSSSILPGVGNSMVVKPKDKNYDDFHKFNFLFVWLSGMATCCLLCLYQPFMEMWVGTDNMLSFSSACLFSIYFFAQMIGNIRAVYSDAAGLWWQNRYRAILEVIANIILNITLGKLFGVNGIILATIITVIIINFGMGSTVLFKYYFTNKSVLLYFANTIFYSVATFIACLCSLYVTNSIKIEGVLGIAIKIPICIIISNIVFVIIYSSTDVFKESKKWVLKLVLSR